MSSSTLKAQLRVLGFSEHALAAIISAQEYSAQAVRIARLNLGQCVDANTPGICSFALGSIGRGEASSQSDLDFAFLYDSKVASEADAQRMRRRYVERLRRDFEIPEKTFCDVVELRELCKNVGGAADSNTNLTYRALTLTEGIWLHNPTVAKQFKRMIFGVYASGIVSRGKFLNSLSNDLQRYYRTLCVDYRFKVEEQSKSWAIRILKLRYSRKLWHLANLCLQCWFADSWQSSDETTIAPYDAQIEVHGARDAMLFDAIAWMPIQKILHVLEYFGAPKLACPLLFAFDYYLECFADSTTRQDLESLVYEERYSNAEYRALRENADRFDDACEAIVRHLFECCGRYLTRFCVL